MPKGADPTDIIIEAMSVAGAGILLVAEFEGKPLVKVAKGLAFASSVAALAKKVLGSGQELSICTAVPSLSKALGSNKVKVLAPSPVAPQIASGHAPQGQTSNILRDLQRTRPLLGSALLPGQSTPPSVPAKTLPRPGPSDQFRIGFSDLLARVERPASFGASLVGTVSDERSGMPVGGAVVQLAGLSPNASQAVVSALDGSFRFDTLAPGQYLMTTQSTGHAAATLMVDLPEGSTVRREVHLVRMAYPCDFEIVNRTGWWIDTNLVVGRGVQPGPRLAPYGSFRFSRVQRPSSLYPAAFFQDGPPIYWAPVDVACGGPLSVALAPPPPR